MLRFMKAAAICYMALFFTFVVFGNVTDFDANFQFVAHVMSMDTTSQSPTIMWRSIDHVWLYKSAYFFIIFIEALSALILWFAGLNLFRHIHSKYYFRKYKHLASLGLFMGFSLYFLGFIVIGGEWFAMWQSTAWNGQAAAGLFATMNMLILLFINQMNDFEVN